MSFRVFALVVVTLRGVKPPAAAKYSLKRPYAFPNFFSFLFFFCFFSQTRVCKAGFPPMHVHTIPGDIFVFSCVTGEECFFFTKCAIFFIRVFGHSVFSRLFSSQKRLRASLFMSFSIGVMSNDATSQNRSGVSGW